MNAARELIQEDLDDSSPEQPLDVSFVHKKFAKLFGGMSLRGEVLPVKIEAERIRFEFLQTCSDRDVAVKVAENFGRAFTWILIAKNYPTGFEARAKKAFHDVECMDLMFDILRSHKDILDKEERDFLERKACSIGLAFVDFLDGK